MSHLSPRLLDAMLERGVHSAEQAHLDQCTGCRQALANLRAVQAAVRDAAPRPPSPLHMSRQSVLFRQSLEQPVSSRNRWIPALPLGAAAMVAAALWLWPSSDPAPAQVADSTPAAAVNARIGVATSPVAVAQTEAPTLALTLPAQTIRPQVTQKHRRRAPSGPARARPPQNSAMALQRSPGEQGPQGEAAGRYEREPDLQSAPRLAKQATIDAESSEFSIDEPRPIEAPTARDLALAVAAATSPAATDSRDAIENAFSRLESARTPPQQHRQLLALQRLLIARARSIEPVQLELSAQRIARLALPSPESETAAYLACELGLQSARFDAAYRLCSTYLDRFPQGPHAREVAYLSGTVARTQLGDCRAAIARYGQAITFSGLLRSYDDRAYLGRALCRAQIGDLEGARGDLDMYLHKRPLARQEPEVQTLIEQLQSQLRR